MTRYVINLLPGIPRNAAAGSPLPRSRTCVVRRTPRTAHQEMEHIWLSFASASAVSQSNPVRSIHATTTTTISLSCVAKNCYHAIPSCPTEDSRGVLISIGCPAARPLDSSAVGRSLDLRGHEEGILEHVQSVLPLDGFFLDIHGAMNVEDMDDAEGDLSTALRQLVGPDCLISAWYGPPRQRHAETGLERRYVHGLSPRATRRRDASPAKKPVANSSIVWTTRFDRCVPGPVFR